MVGNRQETVKLEPKQDAQKGFATNEVLVVIDDLVLILFENSKSKVGDLNGWFSVDIVLVFD